jgi:RNA polymerase sigma-70 factor (ECF subfamily)
LTTPDAVNAIDYSIDELVPLILGGQADLFEEIIRRYQVEVFRAVSALLYDRGPTEDLVQQVFVSAYFALSGFRPGMEFGPWIRTIARNAVREELRKQARYERRLRTYREVLEARLADDPRAEADQEALQKNLQQCLARLPEREAAAVRMRYQQGMGFDEIGAVLGGSNAAIRNLLCRARSRLREWMGREGTQS